MLTDYGFKLRLPGEFQVHADWLIEGPYIVHGHQFGPQLLTIGLPYEEAIDEYDERFGREVDWEADRSTLMDYSDVSLEVALGEAMSCGDIRVTGQGKTVWVDHHAWHTELSTRRAVANTLRGMRSMRARKGA